MTDMDKTLEEAWHRDALSAVLPFESWERLTGESGMAYAAFCVYRDYGPDRNIRRAVEGQFRKVELPAEFLPKAETLRPNRDVRIERRYRMWRAWAAQFRWRERAADYDRYLDRLKQTEMRKTIEEQGERHRAVTKKMLEAVEKKLDMMNPAELTQGTVTEWVETAIRTDREAWQCADAHCLGVSTRRNSTPQQTEINFTPEFEGL